MNLQQHQDDITNFLAKKFEEMNKELGWPVMGGTIGTSVDDSLVLERIPAERPDKLEGFYVDSTETVHCEVMSYRPENGMVVVNVTNPDKGIIEPKLTMIDFALFDMLFVKKSSS